ncbi:hypothetical protein D3C80_1396810 [compost metagenome]
MFHFKVVSTNIEILCELTSRMFFLSQIVRLKEVLPICPNNNLYGTVSEHLHGILPRYYILVTNGSNIETRIPWSWSWSVPLFLYNFPDAERPDFG